MSERTLAPPRAPSTTPEHQDSLTERTWRGVNQIVHGVFHRAQEAQIDAGLDSSPEGTLERAALAQRVMLERADTNEWSTSQVTAHRVALLLFEMPQVRRAHDELEAGKGSRDDNRAIVSTFNSDIVASLAYMPPDMLQGFQDRLFHHGQKTLKEEWGVEPPKKAHIDKIMAGMRHEVAVWRALSAEMPEGWDARLGETHEDLNAVDFVVTNTEGRELRLDSKNRKSFDKKIASLIEGGWITIEQAEIAHTNRYIYRPTTDAEGDLNFTCIFDASIFGNADSFEYEDPLQVVKFIQERYNDSYPQQALRRLGGLATREE